MKKNFYLFLTLLFSVVSLSSCLNEDTKDMADEPVITKFYLYSDSVKVVKDYSFTIDNDKFMIYNSDSMPYLTEIDSLCPVISPKFYKVMINEAIEYNTKDTFYFNFNDPVKITVTASDKKSTATYTVKVNVHQVDPDTFLWKGVKTQVFSGVSTSEKAFYVNERIVYLTAFADGIKTFVSTDASEWTEHQITGLDAADIDFKRVVASADHLYYWNNNTLYSSIDGIAWEKKSTTGEVEHLLFFMNDNLYGVNSGATKLMRLDDAQWNLQCELPSGFPVEGAAVCVEPAPSGLNRLFVLGGKDANGKLLSSLWSTEDISYWSNLNIGSKAFSPRTDAALVQYADGLILFGGRDENGVVATGKQLYSKDYGITWTTPENKMITSSLYIYRYDNSAVTTPKGMLYLIGGRVTDDTSLCDVWYGLRYASIPGFKR